MSCNNCTATPIEAGQQAGASMVPVSVPTQPAALSKLSAEKLAALTDDQKAFFCVMSENDQNLFATAFPVTALPGILDKKKEIGLRDKAVEARWQGIKASISEMPPVTPDPLGGNDILNGIAAAVGVGTVAAVAVTDNTAFFKGVTPSDLTGPLQKEFNNGSTRLRVEGNSDAAMKCTVVLLSADDYGYETNQVDAMSIDLSSKDDGCEIVVNNLTANSVMETVKNSVGTVTGLFQSGLNLVKNLKKGNVENIADDLSNAVESTQAVTKKIGDLDLKNRAWKAMKPTAESLEAQFVAEKERKQNEKQAMFKAWQEYESCPGCSVPFSGNSLVCGVCGTSRPDKPNFEKPIL